MCLKWSKLGASPKRLQRWKVGQHYRDQTAEGKRHKHVQGSRQTTEVETVAVITREMLSLSPLPLGLLERDAEKEWLGSFSCWPFYVGVCPGPSFTLPGPFQATLPPGSSYASLERHLPPSSRLEITKASSHCLCCHYVTFFVCWGVKQTESHWVMLPSTNIWVEFRALLDSTSIYSANMDWVPTVDQALL